jgi:UDP-sulfoquinovose synthase
MICHVENPRVELENHHYNVVHSGLVELGLAPRLLSDTLIESLCEITKRHAHRARPEAMIPTIEWRRPSSVISN